MERSIRFALDQRTWAVVGCSPSRSRDSHRIAALLQRRGHRVIQVNPNCDEVLGERAYARLEDIPEPVDVVDIFRRSDAAGHARGRGDRDRRQGGVDPARRDRRGGAERPATRASRWSWTAVPRIRCLVYPPPRLPPSRVRHELAQPRSVARHQPVGAGGQAGKRSNPGISSARPSPAEWTVPSGSTMWNDSIRSSSPMPGRSRPRAGPEAPAAGTCRDPARGSARG